jgi:hypothetical protein
MEHPAVAARGGIGPAQPVLSLHGIGDALKFLNDRDERFRREGLWAQEPAHDLPVSPAAGRAPGSGFRRLQEVVR